MVKEKEEKLEEKEKPEKPETKGKPVFNWSAPYHRFVGGSGEGRVIMLVQDGNAFSEVAQPKKPVYKGKAPDDILTAIGLKKPAKKA